MSLQHKPAITATQLPARTVRETHTLTLGTTSDTATLSIPSGARLLGVSMNVNVAVTDDAGDDTWSAAFITGSTTTIVSAALAAQNTKVDVLLPVSAHGEISVEGNTTETVITTLSSDFSNKVQVTTFDTDGSELNTDADHTNDHIVIEQAGEYEIHCEAAFSNGSSVNISFALFKNNGVTQLTTRTTRALVAGGDVGSASCHGTATLAVGDTVELWVQNETSTANVVVEDGAISLHKITNDEITNDVTQIRFTPNGGSFSAGEIEVLAYYEQLTSLADV